MRFLPCALAILAFAAGSGTAWADPQADLHDAFGKFMAAKSFRASVTDVKKGQQLSVMEFVAPDRYRLHPQRGPETYIVGDEAYTSVEGRMVKLPLPVGKMVAQFRSENFNHMNSGDVHVTDLGMESVDGEFAHAYKYSMSQPTPSEGKVWVSQKSGLPIQIEAEGSYMGQKSTTRVRYSEFDNPAIKVDAPN